MEKRRVSNGHLLPGDNIERDKSGQGTRRKASSKGHSPTGDIMESDKSGHGKKVAENLPTGDRIGKDMSGHKRKATEQGALTPWWPHQKGQVRTRKESTELYMGTHELKTASGGISQDMKRK